ncbi:SEC-C metal-binding domain-containing protein [Alicyclobacillus macrosporangiidus]|uniref:SEC-C metal-binding domain-containing protein n=1 Tax=Alicyclobacillus macrosporangiidus TaxID=392015 RepID=UPI0009434B3E
MGGIDVTTRNIKRTDPCPCGSTLSAKDCCYSSKPPVTMPIPQYVTATWVLVPNLHKPGDVSATKINSGTDYSGFQQKCSGDT